MMKTPGAILLLVALLGSYEAHPVEGEDCPAGAPHPGTCPPINVMCNRPLPPPQCQSDSECPKTQKCCNVCGNKCLSPVRAHTGLCTVPTLAELKCAEVETACQNDSECLTDQKCCMSMCKRKCVTVHDGFCPYPGKDFGLCFLETQNVQVTCNDDSNCAADEKCCYEMCNRKCVKSLPDTVHAGLCPVPINPIVCFPELHQDMCGSDSNCAADEKCCYTMCHMICRKSLPAP